MLQLFQASQNCIQLSLFWFWNSMNFDSLRQHRIQVAFPRNQSRFLLFLEKVI